MARRKRKDGSGGASWLETYSDMVTLLLTFFVMLYAMSTIDAQKYAMIVEAFSKGNAIITQEDLPEGDDLIDDGSVKETPIEDIDENDEIDKLYKLLKQYIADNNLENSVVLRKTEEYVFIRFSDDITFGGYSKTLNKTGKEILDVLAQGLGMVEEYIEEVIIAGHTAEVDSDHSQIDRKLSTDRANAVLEHLESKNVIDPAKYLAIGYGLYSPIADNSTPEGRAKNRRVEIYISRKGYPVSYTNIIKETINGDSEDKNNDQETINGDSEDKNNDQETINGDSEDKNNDQETINGNNEDKNNDQET